MGERTYKFAGIEITTAFESMDHTRLLEQLYRLRHATGMTTDEKTEKLQAILRDVYDEKK